MSPSLGNIFSGLQQAFAGARQAHEARARSKTDDGRRIYRIACLGHANSGKTTFWTLLEGATRELSDQFNLQTGDNTTAAYLMRQREAMEQGVLWSPGDDETVGERPGVYEPGYPAQTDLVANLLFMARQSGKPEFPILVQDYPGGSVAVEDLGGGSASVAEFLKSADGVLFFIDGIVTRLSRAAIDQQLAAFRSLLRQIEDRRGKIEKPVGVVFTKADTLPGYRRGIPVVLLQPSDLRRRQEPFGKFLEQLLRSNPYTQDPAWRDRVSKTMSRVQSFADMLLKKCASPQFFFVSAVGHKRRRPIEVSRDVEGSIGSGTVGSLVLGKNQVGLAAPVSWMVNELAVMTTVNQARRIRNLALRTAAAWSILVSLTFMTYLGCTTSKIEKDFHASVVPARNVLHDVQAFEEDWIAKAWALFDASGFMATARSARSLVVSQVRDEAERLLQSILEQAGNNPPDELAAKCGRWVVALEGCSAALRDTSLEVKHRDAALRIRCLSRLYGELGRAFTIPTTDARRAAIASLVQPARGYLPCMTDGVKAAIANLLSSVLNATINPANLNLEGGTPGTITAAVGGGTPPYALTWAGPEGTGPFSGNPSITVGRPGTYTLRVTDAAGVQTEAVCTVTGSFMSLKDRYNALLQKYGTLASPEARLTPMLIAELRAMQSEGVPADPPSQEAAKRIDQFLLRAGPFVDGVDVKIKIVSLSTPARLKVAGSPHDSTYVPGETVPLPNWKIGKKVLFQFVMSNKQVPLPIDDLLGNQNKSILVPELQAQGGGGVTLQYEIVEPRVDDQSIPALEPIP